jgi:hypothetical protein
MASKTPGMEFPALVRFQVLPFDTPVARLAQGAVQFVVVLLAIGGVVEDVKFCAWEWASAGSADEALLVISACQAS